MGIGYEGLQKMRVMAFENFVKLKRQTNTKH